MGVEIIEGNPVVVRVTGEIDISNAAEVSAALDKAGASAPGGFVVDMSRVDYTDGSGVRAILDAHKRVSSRGGCVALVAGGIARSLIHTLGLEDLPGLLVCEDLQIARKEMSTRAGQ